MFGIISLGIANCSAILLKDHYYCLAIWTHRNNVIFWNFKCNHLSILEHAMYMFHHTELYNRKTNMIFQDNNVAGTNHCKQNRSMIKNNWIPPPLNVYKWNNGASRTDLVGSTAISFVCRDYTGTIIHSSRKSIRDCPILVVGTLATGEAVREATRMNFGNIIVESDS